MSLADEAGRRGRAFPDRTAGIAGRNRTIGPLVAARVGFDLASVVGRRSV